MTLIVHNDAERFTMVSKRLMQDQRLTLETRGVLGFICSYDSRDGAYIAITYESDSDLKDAYYRGIAQLVEFGYLTFE